VQFARAGHPAALWSREPAHAAALQRDRRNARYLPDAAFPELLEPTADLRAAVAAADDVLIAVPSHALRETLTALSALSLRRLAWATKGFELDTGLLPFQVAGKLLPASLLGGAVLVLAADIVLRLAMPAGRFDVERRSRDGRARGEITLVRGEDRLLPILQPTRYEVARSKGGPLPTETFAGLGAMVVSMPSGGVAPSVRAGIRREAGPAGLILSFDYAGKEVRDRGLSYSWSRVGAEAALMLPIAGARRLVEGGVAAGYGWSTQTLRDRRSFSAGDATAGFALRASVPIGRLRTALDLSGGVRIFELDDARIVRPALSGSLVVLYGF